MKHSSILCFADFDFSSRCLLHLHLTKMGVPLTPFQILVLNGNFRQQWQSSLFISSLRFDLQLHFQLGYLTIKWKHCGFRKAINGGVGCFHFGILVLVVPVDNTCNATQELGFQELEYDEIVPNIVNMMFLLYLKLLISSSYPKNPDLRLNQEGYPFLSSHFL